MVDIAAQEAGLWMFDVPGQSWQDGRILGKSEFDVFDVDEAVARALHLATEREVLGIWGPDEATLPTAAAIADALGLVGPGFSAVSRARDKLATREALTNAGLLQPRSRAVRSLEQAEQVAMEFGIPVVLKPRALGSSLGVVKVENARDLPEAYQVARSATYPGIPFRDDGVLVEEYLDGPEISLDGHFDGAKYTALGVARKHLGFAPYFEEVGHDATRLEERHTVVQEQVAEAHRALGLGAVVSHTEVRLTRRGLAVVEVNARPGGDFIPCLVEAATGLNPVTVSVQTALGKTPSLLPTRDHGAALRFCYVPYDGVVMSVDGNDLLPDAVQYRQLVPLGTLLRLPPRGFVGRYGAVIAVRPQISEARKLVDTAHQMLRSRIERELSTTAEK